MQSRDFIESLNFDPSFLKNLYSCPEIIPSDDVALPYHKKAAILPCLWWIMENIRRIGRWIINLGLMQIDPSATLAGQAEG